VVSDERSKPGYVHTLRAIGRQLDSELAYHASILEVDDGFTVRYQSSPQFQEGRTSHFPYGRLQDLLIVNSAGRGVPGRRRRTMGLWENVRGGREDFYRALGLRLDEQGAAGVTVEELGDGIALSYTSPDPENVLRSTKCHSVLSLQEVQSLIAEAQSRRTEPAAARS
jgi:hypothetical protein